MFLIKSTEPLFYRVSIVAFLMLFNIVGGQSQEKKDTSNDGGKKNSKDSAHQKTNQSTQTPTQTTVQGSNQSSKSANSLPQVAKSTKLPHIEVVGVYKLGDTKRSDKTYDFELENKKGHEHDSAGIGDIIILKIRNFSTLIGRSNGVIDAKGDSVESQKQEIGLFLDGRLIPDLAPESGAPLKDTTTKEDIGTVRFHLQRNSHNDEAWADILGSPKNSFFIYKNMPVSVGLVNEYAEESHAVFNLIRIRPGWFWFCLFAMLAYLFGLFVLARNSNVIRDHGIDASSIGIVRRPQSNPFSLARVQMAFWFSLVIASYLLIWRITGATDILTTSTLSLIGISALTALSAVVIDNNKGQDLVKQTSLLKEEADKLAVEIAGMTTSVIASNPAMQATLDQKNARLAEVQSAIEKNKSTLTQNLSSGFLTDILTDENGVSFHRLQMVVCTLILGLLFVHSVWTRLSMPDFSTTLLALQGMTAGTYLGFKIPEKQG